VRHRAPTWFNLEQWKKEIHEQYSKREDKQLQQTYKQQTDAPLKEVVIVTSIKEGLQSC